MNYQHQPLETVVTGSAGWARTTLESPPYYAVADDGSDKGYLKMNAGGALPTSHFDVGGKVVAEGLKGRIYGERGVWRPGDDIHLTFVLDDTGNPLPRDHPATLRLFNPMGQVVHSVTNADPVGDFYAFTLSTDAEAPTGNWERGGPGRGRGLFHPAQDRDGDAQPAQGGARPGGRRAPPGGSAARGHPLRAVADRCRGAQSRRRRAGVLPPGGHLLPALLGLPLRRSPRACTRASR